MGGGAGDFDARHPREHSDFQRARGGSAGFAAGITCWVESRANFTCLQFQSSLFLAGNPSGEPVISYE